jgi:catechol-2,3-dioxygenase
MKKHFKRADEDLANVVGLEHINVRVSDQRLATLFYISGLGLTRDPYLVTGVVNMWVNVGRSQFHLPVGKAQVLRGRTGIVVPDLSSLAQSLKAVGPELKKTKFSYRSAKGHIDVTCPWGNRFRCHQPGAKFGTTVLGIVYIVFDTPVGTADGIARFYRDILGTAVTLGKFEKAAAARISVGHHQQLIFREKKGRQAKYDGHHIQLYVNNFSVPHANLAERGLVTEESNQHQYRFRDIVDPESGAVLYTLEHEIRSMTHPLYARPLINRNPAQTNNAFSPGYDEQPWAAPVTA